MTQRQEHRQAHHGHEPPYERTSRYEDDDNDTPSTYERSMRPGAEQSGNRESGWQGDERTARGDRYARTAAHTDFRGIGPKGYVRSDARMVEDICDRLTEEPRLDASGIEVTVTEGKVTLTGDVEARWMKHLAEDIVDHCTGVREIHNRIRVHPREDRQAED
jgi:osmotically-inducible protein OsmY